MQLLSKAIHGILTADTDITDTVGSGNIWHSKIPQRTSSGSDTPVPISIYFYTYAVNPTGSTKTGRAEIDEHMIRVAIVGSDDEDMYEVARYVRYALDRITPGTYSDIPIQGIDFLNASFDPEGSYELENQSWVLEFKVRVIDNDIRVPPAAAAAFSNPSWWYSTSEQTWPYSKWINGETIYWKTTIIDSNTALVAFDPLPNNGVLSQSGYEVLSIIPAHIVKRETEWLTEDSSETTYTEGTEGIMPAADGKTYIRLAQLAATDTYYITLYYTKA